MRGFPTFDAVWTFLPLDSELLFKQWPQECGPDFGKSFCTHVCSAQLLQGCEDKAALFFPDQTRENVAKPKTISCGLAVGVPRGSGFLFMGRKCREPLGKRMPCAHLELQSWPHEVRSSKWSTRAGVCCLPEKEEKVSPRERA